MLNSNENNQNNVSPYLNWFGKDNQELKRGGTAPIMFSRRSRPTAGLEILNLENNNEDQVFNEENNKEIPMITTSYGASSNLNNSRRGINPAETHSISKVFNTSGMGIYRLTKKKSGAGESQLPPNNLDALLPNPNIHAGSIVKAERKNYQTSIQQDKNQKDLRETPISFFNSGLPSNTTNNRPGSSHYKGGSAFRRCRIMNESPQNFEEYQTPNTGNLELESLNNINNQSSARESSPTLQLEQRSKQNEILFIHEPKIVSGKRLQVKKGEKTADEGDSSLKSFNDPRALQRINLKTNGSKRGVFAQEDFDNDKPNEAKVSKISISDAKHKAKQVLEGRRYAEDIESLNISDPEDDFKFEGYGNRNIKDQSRNEEKQKDNFVENFFYGSPQKFILDQEGEVNQEVLSLQRTPVERPPARKNGQAMNLDDRATVHQPDKKHLMKSPIQLQEHVLNKERPPSRHKIPNKALGLDLPENVNKHEVGRSSQNYEKEGLVTQKKEIGMIGRKGHNIKNRDPGFDFENDEFEHLNFDKMLDLSDFLEGDENEPNLNHLRPKTTAINPREANNTSQSFRSKEGMKHIGLQSAKGRPIATQSLGHNALLSSKLEAFNRMRNNKTKTETRLESVVDPSKEDKSKNQTEKKEDVETLEVFDDVDSESSNSSGSISNKQSQPSSNRFSKGQLEVRPWKPEKMTKNNFLSDDHSIFKDKKSQILFIHHRGSQTTKKETVDLPFETTLEKDFVGLFAN